MSKLTKKLFALVLLSGALSVMLFFVGRLSAGRAQRRDAVVAEIAQSYASSQQITGPILVEEIERKTSSGSTSGSWIEYRYAYPRTLDIDSSVTVESRHRGIFSVPTFSTTQTITGEFESLPPLENATIKRTRLLLGVSDTRGFARSPSLVFGGKELVFEPGLHEDSQSGVHATVPSIAWGGAARTAFEIRLEVVGTTGLSWAAIAREATVRARSPWPHPSFFGSALPAERSVARNGFEATWRTNPYQSGTSLTGTASQVGSIDAQSRAHARAFGVMFVSPGDAYAQVDRAVKYGFLFVFLTFAVFGVFESTRKLPVHPVQYGMVGVALVLFFLMLLSLAEHLSFGASYAAAATACITLLVYYLRHVLGHWQRSASFGGLFAALYGTLFVLLRLEEYALVVGAGFLFAVLAAAMIITRKVDWYRIGEGEGSEPSAKDPYRAWVPQGGGHWPGTG